MRLKKIKLAGFKSFVDPTTVPMPSNLVGVVGPNGCGKSNVIDAVRWVMGESSAKNLRGDSLADVIFNGSTGRKPVGQAIVELVFDNCEGKLGGEYASYAEISIKRQLSRDGQSNYYLNGTKCRRRDITDIFLGTGLGPRSYAIIEQGMISRLIEAKPEDLRVFIEEAAGISKYKERRRETETRIKHTRENLDRINDLREELEKRINTLQRQAKTAERYKELKQEERLLKAQLLALRYQSLNTLVDERDKQIQSQETKLEAAIAELRRVEAVIENQREQQIEVNEKFNEIQGRYYALGSEIARLEQSIQHAKETRAQKERELAELERNWQEAMQHLESDQSSILRLEEADLIHDEQLQTARNAETESSAILAEAESAMHAWQSEWDEFNRQSSEQMRSAEVERARIQHLEQGLSQLSGRLARLEDELRGLSAGELDKEIEQLHLERAQIEEQQVQLRFELEQQAEQITHERELVQTLNTELDAERSRMQSMQGRKSSLEALQQQALGKDQRAVGQWLDAQGLGNAKRLAQNLDVERGWERAVELVLGLHLEAVCVEGMQAVTAALGQLNQGAVTIFDVSTPAKSAINGTLAQPLLGKVKSSRSLDSFLGGIYVAETLDEALALRSQLQIHESVVTRDGIWVGYDWLRAARGNDEKSGVLQREQELRELGQSLEELSARTGELQQQLESSRVRLRDLERNRDQLQVSLQQATQQLSRVESQLSARQERLQQYHNRKQRLEQELSELQQQRAQNEEHLAQSRARLDEALNLSEGYNQRREQLMQQRDELRDQLEQRRQRARQDRDTAHEIALKLQSIRTQLEGTRQRLERMQGQMVHLERRREELQSTLQGTENPIAEMVTQLEELLQQRLGVEEELLQARRAVEEIDHAMREAGDQRHQAEQKSQEIRTELEQMRMASQEFRVRRQTVLEQFAETGLNMEETFGQLLEGANEPQWQEQVNEIGQKISRLGAINLAAIDEFKEQSERKGYLDAQYADLIEALTTLENAIRKIDKETRTRFKDTFDQVDKGFQTLFPRLFGGGHAYLEMTGEDLLDTGVTVMARPPGKRNSSIHLLSGGEKALTAVALVFSIFQLNPAPFCMLDEVDAPLDEANVGRFCKMVKEMSETVQFIFITHNKATMEMSEQLTGVTMHEPGVSRLVAVDVEEAVKLAAS
ncbi:MAG: chromosome segregation protein SMC [Gammaproteobacteria bacterium]|nr:chromosome segregation protein SMC [Gammaproteobacteria bacterium]